MNKEAMPLIIAILAPIILISLIYLFINGYDFITLFKKVDLIYYIVVFPIALGLLVAILRYKKE